MRMEEGAERAESRKGEWERLFLHGDTHGIELVLS